MTALAELYDVGFRGPRRMVESFSFTAISRGQAPRAAAARVVNLELLGDDASDSPARDYFASFFSVADRDNLAFLNEKDAAYREPLIRALSRPAAP